MAKIDQPNEEQQRELNSIVTDAYTEVDLRGKRVKLGWLRNGTIRKVTEIEMSIPLAREDMTIAERKVMREQELQRNTKKVAAILLNGYWKIKFFWWFKWRWMYFIKQYRESELMPLLAEAKKKVDVQAAEYYGTTIYSTAMTDMMMAMTKTEAERFRQGLLGAQATR